MKKLFRKIPIELPKPPSRKENHQSLLHANKGVWYTNKFKEKLPAMTGNFRYTGINLSG